MVLFDTRLVGGDNGKSAYQYAIESGYKGSESEFAETLADIGVTLTSTLPSGQTTLTFTDEKITADSVLNAVYTSVFGASVESAEFIDGSLTLEFVKQDENMDVMILIDAAMADGIHGEDGEKGADGKSAYQYAVDGGYEGTEEEFAKLLNGISNLQDDVESLENMIYPIGSIYLSVNDVNPSTLFGGTWEKFGNGRTLVGVDENDTDFATVELEGGEKTHTLTIDEMPAHTHSEKTFSISTGSYGGYDSVNGNTKITSSSTTSGSSGGDQPHNNLQPYITVYMWKRTA